jgi:putative transcriptional regulator
MGKTFDSIAQGLHEAIEYEQGKRMDAKVHQPEDIDVAAIRRKLGLTQVEFATKFCISLGTLRHWERGDRKPHGPALALLQVVTKEPEAVLRALA